MKNFKGSWGSVFAAMAIHIVAVQANAVPYAVEVINVFHPTGTDGGSKNPNRALGLSDNINYSMGDSTGFIDLRMGQPIVDIPGYDFVVWQEGTDDHIDESADVFLSFDAQTWVLVHEIRRFGDLILGDGRADIAGTGMSGAEFVRVRHFGGSSTVLPGFDLDAVTIVLPQAASIPEPTTFVFGVVGIAAVALRRRPVRLLEPSV